MFGQILIYHTGNMLQVTHVITNTCMYILYLPCRKLKPTCKSQIRTSPPRQPEARIWLDVGWKAMHQGVRGWPLKMLRHFPVATSDTLTVWSPWVEATLVLKQNKNNIFFFISILLNKKNPYINWYTYLCNIFIFICDVDVCD